jgi:hypothetical protein
MKTLKTKCRTLVLSLSLLAFLFISCSDDDNENQQNLTDEEVNEVLKSSLIDEGGIILDIEQLSTTMGTTAGRPAAQTKSANNDLSLANCNQSVSQSFLNTNTVGNRSWTITSNWSWTLNCDAQNMSISYDLEGDGTLDFDGPNLSKDITRTHDFNITGIEPASSEWVYNAIHNRNGLIQSNVGNQNSMNTTLTYGSTDIVVSKASQQIISGTFNVNFQATLPNGNVVTRGATVIFNGNQTATVTLDNGNTFDVNW